MFLSDVNLVYKNNYVQFICTAAHESSLEGRRLSLSEFGSPEFIEVKSSDFPTPEVAVSSICIRILFIC